MNMHVKTCNQHNYIHYALYKVAESQEIFINNYSLLLFLKYAKFLLIVGGCIFGTIISAFIIRNCFKFSKKGTWSLVF